MSGELVPVNKTGSPKFRLSEVDWNSVLWQLGTAALAAVLTVLADSILPEWQAKNWIDGGIFTALVTTLHALRKYLTDTRIAS